MKKKLLAIIALTVLGCSAVTLSQADDAKPAAKPYPLKTCIVSGEKLGEMGSPSSTNYNGQEFKFCCKDCIKDFAKDPAKFEKKLAKAEKKLAPKSDK
jgi:YHS domain-containing protein